MTQDSKRLVDYLVGLGIEKVGHTGKTYLAHLVAVYRFMQAQGCDEDLCRAGMFHSIYGTEQFQGFKLSLEQRPEIRTLIGERAERLAYLNCAMNRATFDDALDQRSEPHQFVDRITGDNVLLTARDFDDLCRIHLCDWLEQAPRSRLGWGYRRAAYRWLAERLGGISLQTYDRIFAQEPIVSTS
jgi:hypothetical protein